MKLAKRLSAYGMAALLVLLLQASLAWSAGHPAEAVVKKATDNVIVIVEDARSYYDKDPQKFYTKIDAELSQIIDFQSFARGVMGAYGSSAAYRALKTEQEKEAFKKRVYRFSEVFRQSLVETYSKGLFAFGGQKIEVAALPKHSNEKAAVVEQRVYAKDNSVYKALYKMRLSREGDWKVRNVTIEAVNVGKVYQSQFQSAVRRYQGDVDKAIDNWSVEL